MANKKNRCSCTHAKSSCKTHSKVRMCFLLKAPHSTTVSASERYYYSTFHDDHTKDNEGIIKAMLKRLGSKFTKDVVNYIYFYDNITRSNVPLKLFSTNDY
jgi:hypothetical protein